jgi:nitrogen-specific signal transduction histidine kinase/ActR/RegA family two-component response regulator
MRNAQGERIGFRGVTRNTTEKRKAEEERAALQEQLRQAQKMEAIGTLAGGIAHDFNNILAGILGYAELASLDIPEGSEAKYNLQQSIKSTYRAKDLVQQILAFSRQSKQERKPLDIRPIIKEALKMLRASLPSTIEIRQNIEADWGAIEADPTQIHQVLMNLCTNAAHAMSENGGVLEVSLTKFDMDAGTSGVNSEIEPGPYLKLRVSDTGSGMPPEILSRIFDPYFTTKETGKGTGLGLAVVHGIVKSHRGAITVSSEPGKGTTFDIYFPRGDIIQAPSELERIEPLPLGGRERILFVDDEKAIVEIGQKLLERLGYEVVSRTSSVEALELFRAKPESFDLVVTDMTMPNMTGDKLARELMGIRPDIPVILCTGFSERITEEKAKLLGIREFVMKPLVMKDLAKSMRRALDGQKKKKG